jgi:hypothetical protein
MKPYPEAERKETQIPERASLLLFVLNKTNCIPTELKLQKLVFQIQNEAKALQSYDFIEHYYGPYSQEISLDTSTLANAGLITKDILIGRNHPYYMFWITEAGRDYFNKSILPDISPKFMKRMTDTLDKYSACSPNQLAEIVYQEWGIKNQQKLTYDILELKKDFQAVSAFWESKYFPDCPIIPFFLASIEYAQEALGKLEGIKDTVKKGTLIGACRELHGMLSNIAEVFSKENICPLEAEKGLCKNADPSISEVFSFIEDFCERHKILQRLSNREISELVTEDEYKRLLEAFQTFKT